MSGGGSGGSGTQQYNWNPTMQGYWDQQLEYGRKLRDTPYVNYPNNRVALLNEDQLNAGNNIRNLVGTEGTAASRAASGEIQKTLGGNYLTGSGANPFASQENEYAGMDSPFFRDTLQNNLQDITDQYKNGVAADTTRMFNMAGAFGGSAHQNKMANNEAGLGKTLSRFASDFSNDQYNRSAGLEESRLGRGSGAFENERGRMMGALGAGQNDQSLAFERQRQLMGVGDLRRSFDQQFLDDLYNRFQESQNHPFKMSDWFSGLMSRAQGGMSPNMTFTPAGSGASLGSSLLGAGLLGYGLMGPGS
jgi:hypothetical protein